MVNLSDEHYMQQALNEANKALLANEVPVGAVIVKDGEIISRGYNMCEGGTSGILHAEMVAINSAGKHLGDWRLEGCKIYVTLEPCAMCSGAIIGTRISEVIYGASEIKYGCMGSLINMSALQFASHPSIKRGIMEKECQRILKVFFGEKRK